MRPTTPLRAHLRRPGEVHLGVGSDAAVVLSGLTDAETRAVVALGPMTARQWVSARLARPPSPRWPDVLQLLGDAAHGLTAAVPDVGGVVVSGTGSVPQAIREVIHEMGECRTPAATAVAVLVGAEHLYAGTAGRWHRDGVPHLPVTVGARRAMIGPLIRPGNGPCIRCLDHHRAARDQGWAPIALEQPWHESLGADAERWPSSVSAPADLRAVVAGLVGLVIRGYLSGRPVPVGVSLTIDSPQPRVQHRLWRPHPRCCPDAGG